MRGIHIPSKPKSIKDRITPAHAGNTLLRGRGSGKDKDHPRTCGEYRLICVSKSGYLWITPAHAGNTIASLQPVQRPQDHPRTCGEYTKKIAKIKRFIIWTSYNSFSLE